MTTYAKHVSTRVTPQSQAITGSTQVPNSAGGFAWKIDCWQKLDRFISLGCEGGSYYAGERDLTLQASAALAECAKLDPVRTVNRIVEISKSGLAPKNAPAVFALAQLSKDHINLVEPVMPEVCRTATDMFAFFEQARAFRGTGRSLCRTVAGWYASKNESQLSYQLAKYQQRNGWTHRDVLRLCHAKLNSPTIRWAMGMSRDERVAKRRSHDRKLLREDRYAATEGELPLIIQGMELAKGATSAAQVARLISDYRLVRECIPTQWLNSPEVWEALLVDMPLTAMIRNLGKMSSVGLLKPLSHAALTVATKLGDMEHLRKSRVHPLGVLLALTTYASGRGFKGSNTWTVVPQVLDALNEAFYLTFGLIQPTGKRWLFGLDVSGSMSSEIAGTNLTRSQATACLAMIGLRTEPQCYVHGFATEFRDLGLSKTMRLDSAVRNVSNLTFGGTDCALPMIWALKNRIEVDVFCVCTDNETWHGRIHPSQALVQYQQKTGVPAKLIVAAFTANDFSIADPGSAAMLDIVGLDSSVPQVMNQFVVG